MKKKRILQICLLLVLLFSSYKILRQLKGDRDFQKSQVKVQETKKTWQDREEASQEAAIKEFEELKKTMPPLVAWLSIPGTDIDFPVVQAADNDYYLNHDYEGNYNPLGAIFLDKDNAPDFQNQNSIIYGHNVRRGKIFHTLTNYLDPAYVQKAPKIELLTARGRKSYQIQAVYSADPYDNFRSPQYEGKKWEEFTGRWKERNILDFPPPSPRDRLLTLQTCLDGDRRLAIHGVEEDL